MLELKLMRVTLSINKAVLGLCLKSLNNRSKSALRKYNKKTEEAAGLFEFAEQAKTKAEDVLDEANTTYNVVDREITSAYNRVENTLDDVDAIAKRFVTLPTVQ